METEVGALWEKVLQEVEKHLNKVSFDAWVKQIRPLNFQDDLLLVEVPNEFTRDWLENRHKDLLVDSLRKVAEKDCQIQFQCGPTIKEESEQDFTSSSQEYRQYQPQSHSAGTNRNSTIKSNNTRNPSTLVYNPPWLNPKYTFETFVVGGCNRLAHAASLAVAEAPSKAYNPLFIYGGVGLGKTHLMHAIGHFVISNYSQNNVFYLSSEKFMNEFINAIRDNKTVDFRNKYRNIDVLLVDDIQFLAGKEQTQEEFFHTFNALHESNKQIIISSDRPPKEIPTLEDRLRSRFEWGLITDITKPDLETRIAILKKKAHTENVQIPSEVLNYIASKIETNIRELEGALIRVMAYSSLNNTPVDLDIADEALDNILIERKSEVTVEKIIQTTAEHFDISPEDIKAKKRSKNIAFPRQIAMFLSRELTEHSLPKLGNEFGGKDHTTIIHAYNKIKKSFMEDPEVRDIIDSLKHNIVSY